VAAFDSLLESPEPEPESEEPESAGFESEEPSPELVAAPFFFLP
jgi:hypothetical protein